MSSCRIARTTSHVYAMLVLTDYHPEVIREHELTYNSVASQVWIPKRQAAAVAPRLQRNQNAREQLRLVTGRGGFHGFAFAQRASSLNRFPG